MNARTLFTMSVVIALLGSTAVQAGQAVGTAKARGDYRSFSKAYHMVSQSRPVYRCRPMSTQSAPVAVNSSPTTQPAPAQATAKAPMVTRRFSEAPSTENQATTASSTNLSPAASTAPQAPASVRRYSYAPAPAYSGYQTRRYMSNSTHSEHAVWPLPKADPNKYHVH